MTEKDSEKPKTSKRKLWADKGLSLLSHFMKFYVIAIPMFYAIILLWLIDSLSKIPEFE